MKLGTKQLSWTLTFEEKNKINVNANDQIYLQLTAYLVL